MNWKRFKELVEEAGVTDEMEISWIDVGMDYDNELTIGIDDEYFTVAD